jgi:hyperosmotically inducible periplasmic protein
MSAPNRTHVLAWSFVLCGLSLTACDKPNEEKTTGQKVDQVINKVDDKVEDAKAGIEEKLDDAKKSTSAAAEQATASITDSAITTGVKAKLAGDMELKTLDISINTEGGHVVMQGTAPNASARTRARQLAAAVQGVEDVDNQLIVSKP